MQRNNADDRISPNGRVSNLEQVLERMNAAAGGSGRVSFGDIIKEIKERSFGLWLLLAGLIALAPLIGDIPGITTILAVFIFLTAAQMLMRRRHIWLPNWLTRRSVKKERINKAIGTMYRPARFIDRYVRPRLTVLVHETGAQSIALVCLAIALLMPFMEVVPFSANGAGLALSAFGLGLIARDGLLVLAAYVCTIATFVAVLAVLL
ncbi:MAG TPA: exopolysaccharide biosynthesis protein [Desulfobacterales bacterium]|jgi:hypothetical protein|nr:exopolysaccharide biosynthesis protein [Desulfobacterales bacterium]